MVTVKIPTMAGVLTTIATADFFEAVKNIRKGGTVTINGVQYDATGIVLDESTSYTIKGDIDCNASPNYPVGIAGDAYRVSVAGLIGGASGKTVEINDVIVCWVDNAGGTQAAVGSSWSIEQANVVNLVRYIECASASGTTYTGSAITGSDATPALVKGLTVVVKVDVVNSGASTIAVDGLTAKNIKKRIGAVLLSLVAGDLQPGLATLRYDGTQFILDGARHFATAILVGGSVTVADANVAATTQVVHQRSTLGDTAGHLSYALNAGVSIVFTSSSGTDTSTILYEIVKY